MILSSRSTSRPDLFSVPLEGMRRGMAGMEAAAEKIADGDLSPENIVAQMQAGLMVKASAAALRTAGRMLGTMIDTTA